MVRHSTLPRGQTKQQVKYPKVCHIVIAVDSFELKKNLHVNKLCAASSKDHAFAEVFLILDSGLGRAFNTERRALEYLGAMINGVSDFTK